MAYFLFQSKSKIILQTSPADESFDFHHLSLESKGTCI